VTIISKSDDVCTQNLPIIMNDEFDFDNNSIVDAAIMVESEITGISVKEFKDTLRLQHLVIRSKLSSYVVADKNKLHKLIECLYQEQGFQGDWKAFFMVKNALISSVLSRRKGIPISLGILLLDFLKASDFNAQGICFPSGFIISVHLDNEIVYLDPFTGELPSKAELELKVRGQLGNHMRLNSSMLEADDNKTIIMRLLNVIKASYIQAESLESALLCCDILLRIAPEDAYEVRDRGFLFQQLDCFNLARSDFEFFIDQYPKDPIVNLLKQQIKHMNNETTSQVIH
jgi:regulator of sirC expression with transglutaminase-like and TPR domain